MKKIKESNRPRASPRFGFPRVSFPPLVSFTLTIRFNRITHRNIRKYHNILKANLIKAVNQPNVRRTVCKSFGGSLFIFVRLINKRTLTKNFVRLVK
ncbi:hypothetical protein HanIR_Chr09g0427411 [Helianthus annuus]|nr:hypothetical protein HanIR_Chr09g0427411 [Helianthus annuus]